MSGLRELAEKATPGQWAALIDNYGEDTWPGSMFVTADPTDTQAPLCDDLTQDDARYIAAANPTEILRLLDTLDSLTAELRALEEALTGLRDAAVGWLDCERCSAATGTVCMTHRPDLRAALSEGGSK